MENLNSRYQLIHDFFYLQLPKHLSADLIVKIIVLLLLPLIPCVLVVTDLADGISLYIGFLLLVYLIWLRPRWNKKRKYNSRISSDVLNNWFLETLKTKILDRAVQYLDLSATEYKTEQFIIVPYPVFHSTKKVKDECLLRVKSVIKPQNKQMPEEFCYNYNVWNIQILVLSQNYISYYFCTYNWLKDEILNEKTNEYFYHEIALVKTDFEQVSFQTKWEDNPITEARITKLIHTSGDVLSLISELPELHQPAKTLVDIEKFEKVLRMLIRHAKALDESRKQVDIKFKQPEIKAEPVEL
ncbi:MAG: hypothetical protein U0W24_23365 [Bacteroidales bacterium]